MGELQPFKVDAEQFRTCDALAQRLAASALIPQHYRGDVASVMLAVTIAAQTGMHPLMVMQGTYVVSGKLGWGASMLIALANGSGVFDGPLDWRINGTGADLSVTCFATLAKSRREVSATVSMAMAKAEGWTHNTKYQTMPELMLRYRSATRLTRLYAPGVLFGIPAADENEDVAAAKSPEPVKLTSAAEPATAPASDPAVVDEGHHPSFDAKERGRFFQALRDIGVDYDDLCRWRELNGRPRPSALDNGQRRELVAWLTKNPDKMRAQLAAADIVATEATADSNIIDAEVEPAGGVE